MRQSVHGAVHERAAPRDIRRHDGKRQRYGDPLPGPQRERVECRVCRFDRAERGVVPLGEREERVAGPHRVHGVPAKPWRERALGLRAEYAVRRQAVRALEGLQSAFRRPAENAVGAGAPYCARRSDSCKSATSAPVEPVFKICMTFPHDEKILAGMREKRKDTIVKTENVKQSMETEDKFFAVLSFSTDILNTPPQRSCLRRETCKSMGRIRVAVL